MSRGTTTTDLRPRAPAPAVAPQQVLAVGRTAALAQSAEALVVPVAVALLDHARVGRAKPLAAWFNRVSPGADHAGPTGSLLPPRHPKPLHDV
jgi:hypothetical protein